MKHLESMGAITHGFMKALEDDFETAVKTNSEATFMAEKAGHFDRPSGVNNGRSNKKPLAKNERKRRRKQQRAARKAQRA